ncbi:hypothetical protein [Deinococcus apachensis]|uniref:hypothetical protein n=1 Tax=Deinococcus apachensis TaxID=309886 RepID=UPI000377687D|nr:hypothetical protein [Deinococcus apachensis]
MLKRKLFTGLGTALALAACGVVPTPPITIPDVTLNLQSSAASQGRVIYVRQDAFGGASIPKLLQGLSISGDASYTALGGNLSEVAVYVRTSMPSGCQGLTADVVACDPARESGQAIGTIALQAGASRPFTLSGPALDTAGKSGHGYFGVRAVRGDSLTGEQLRLINLKARARF